MSEEQLVTDSSEEQIEQSMEERMARAMNLPEDAPDEGAVEEEQKTEENQSAAETEEVELDGKKYEVPKEIKNAILRQADYTQKTQSLAEERRAIAQQGQLLALQQQFNEASSSELKQLASIDAKLSEYSKIDWNSLNTDEMIRAKHAVDQLREAKSSLDDSLKSKYAEFQRVHAEETAKVAQSVQKVLEKQIPNWSAETAKSIVEYGKSEGYTDVELLSLNDPRMIKTIWKAQQFDKLNSVKVSDKQVLDKGPSLKPNSSQPKPGKQIDYMNFRKAINKAPTETAKAQLIEQRLANRLR